MFVPVGGYATLIPLGPLLWTKFFFFRKNATAILFQHITGIKFVNNLVIIRNIEEMIMMVYSGLTGGIQVGDTALSSKTLSSNGTLVERNIRRTEHSSNGTFVERNIFLMVRLGSVSLC